MSIIRILLFALLQFSCVTTWAAEFTGSAGLFVSNGEAGSIDGSVASRLMITYGLDGFLAAKWKRWFAGGGATYEIWNQAVNPTSVSNTNLRGTMTNAGLAAGVEVGSMRLILRYNFLSDMKLDQTNSIGQTVAYADPSSYNIQLRFSPEENVYFGAAIQSTRYSSIVTDGTSSSLGGAAMKFESTQVTAGGTF